jgi:hypothetical protein
MVGSREEAQAVRVNDEVEVPEMLERPVLVVEDQGHPSP